MGAVVRRGSPPLDLRCRPNDCCSKARTGAIDPYAHVSTMRRWQSNYLAEQGTVRSRQGRSRSCLDIVFSCAGPELHAAVGGDVRRWAIRHKERSKLPVGSSAKVPTFLRAAAWSTRTSTLTTTKFSDTCLCRSRPGERLPDKARDRTLCEEVATTWRRSS